MTTETRSRLIESAEALERLADDVEAICRRSHEAITAHEETYETDTDLFYDTDWDRHRAAIDRLAVLLACGSGDYDRGLFRDEADLPEWYIPRLVV